MFLGDVLCIISRAFIEFIRMNAGPYSVYPVNIFFHVSRSSL